MAHDMEKQNFIAFLGNLCACNGFRYWDGFIILVKKLNIILAYKGNLLAMLTLPARSKAIDTFSDLLELPDEATVGIFQWSSMNEILQETPDPMLQEGLLLKTNRLYSFTFWCFLTFKWYYCLIYIAGCQQTDDQTRFTAHSCYSSRVWWWSIWICYQLSNACGLDNGCRFYKNKHRCITYNLIRYKVKNHSKLVKWFLTPDK